MYCLLLSWTGLRSMTLICTEEKLMIFPLQISGGFLKPVVR